MIMKTFKLLARLSLPESLALNAVKDMFNWEDHLVAQTWPGSSAFLLKSRDMILNVLQLFVVHDIEPIYCLFDSIFLCTNFILYFIPKLIRFTAKHTWALFLTLVPEQLKSCSFWCRFEKADKAWIHGQRWQIESCPSCPAVRN